MGGLFLFSEIYVRKDVVLDMGAKIQEYYSSQEEVVTEGKTNTQVDEIKNLRLNQLVNFKEHPFKVETNTELFELMQSIEKDGVLVPLLARPNPNGEGYELISGHRRKAACEWAGVTEVPVIIRDLDNCQAVIAMVDSNLQRENIKPSEKAFAYRMKLEAMKQQGKRNDLTFPQVEEKLELSRNGLSIDNPTLELGKVDPFINENGEWGIKNSDQPLKVNSNKELAKVTIVDTNATKEGPMDFDGKKQYVRFIAADYYQKDYSAGGLELTSKWTSDTTYRNTLAAAMNNVKGEDGNWSNVVMSFEFSKEDIDKVKQFVKDQGMGNSKNGNALSRFTNQILIE